MQIKYDFHSHSTASDGTLTPSRLVARAADMGVHVLALTDHDTLEGLEEARQAALEHDIRIVTGAEISVTWNGQTVHIVALGIDPANQGLGTGLQKLVEYRHWRAAEIGRRLEKHGISGAHEGVVALSNGRLVSRTHFARFLVGAGEARDMRDCFKRFLVRGRPGHVSGEWATLEEALGWIYDAGGHAVIAHPARYGMTRTKLRRLIGEFQELGGEAIEVVSGSHSKDECYTMARHAKDFDLHASTGSDFHTPENQWVELGRLMPLPVGCKPVWELLEA
ncbi:phosphatase [Solemya velum gill symbiont]|uniref:PHP domain-containing protein n=1 Tax=Solemya velum gill symbiont TaxID=2340 RepID=UPI0009973EE2|nr:PHP domain-containing protein [Solemya velum gill symbiont]OOZ14537.1 phosphatase [Solemya velum gill symbiont]OOZ17144.1 phosphatase [Solemya velum gill symbiont]OOZ19346.1 phosphatase [Solemya velum gill symbiont]OOZ21787.1 phosphatase [Solemya velum gill symbiont]OOZ24363.1 phosphatase [Solemya velum gill symbiont]